VPKVDAWFFTPWSRSFSSHHLRSHNDHDTRFLHKGKGEIGNVYKNVKVGYPATRGIDLLIDKRKPANEGCPIMKEINL
jgi:hypothetical protein